MIKISALAAFTALLTGCADTDTAETPAAPSVFVTCEIGTPVAVAQMGVSKEFDIRLKPNGDKITNAKATNAVGKTIYHDINPSVAVKQLCVEGNWTLVQITSPEWLVNIKGWAPSSLFYRR